MRSIPGALDYARLAEQHRPADAAGYAAAARQLAAQGLKSHDIAQALRLSVAAVSQFLDPTTTGGLLMKPDPRTSIAATVGGAIKSDLDERTAAQERHAAEALANVTKSRAPGEVLTPDEAMTIARSETGGSGTP